MRSTPLGRWGAGEEGEREGHSDCRSPCLAAERGRDCNHVAKKKKKGTMIRYHTVVKRRNFTNHRWEWLSRNLRENLHI